jgi:8-oxo-dGTP pyrophosphatase MutT (NUDIX family)
VLNQPAGHLDPNETLTEAAVRETLEETGWDVEPTGVLGIYLYTAPSNGVTYQRVCFAAKPSNTTRTTSWTTASSAPSG